MEDSIEKAVKRAIDAMRENLGEQLTVDDMARAAMFSKFHFTRIFQRVTGVSPGRFLSALRLQEAKHLLVSTSLNVADISLRVGYNSVGTFSSRFSRSVGMSPIIYRRRGGFAAQIPIDQCEGTATSTARVYGEVRPHSEQSATGLLFVGLFPDRILEGRPVRCAVLTRPGRFQFDTVPPGSWHLLTQSVPVGLDTPHTPSSGSDALVSVANQGPLVIRQDTVIRADLRLRPICPLDPPALLALLDVREFTPTPPTNEMAMAGTVPSIAPIGTRAARSPATDRTAA